MIGWTDPNQPNPQKPLRWLRSLTHDKYMYPEETWNPNQPPSCIFMPDTALFNKMIETVARTPENKELLYAKFSDMEPPIPQWMIDDDMAKQERIAEENRILSSQQSLDTLEKPVEDIQ